MSNYQASLPAEARRIATDPARRIFALADGARFDDLPGALAACGISHRSLYRNVQDAELVRAGPWLIDPYRQPDPTFNAWGGLPLELNGDDAVAADSRAALQEPQADAPLAGASEAADPERQLETLVQLIGDAPAAVFWIGGASLTEASLWRHLRTLNMVLIPKEYDRQDIPPPAEGEETHEAVMFRHVDGNVLAEVLPVLDAVQFSRVFGPAKALLFPAPDHPAADGSLIRRAVLPADAPPAQPGLLRLSMDEMRGIEEARLDRSRRKVMNYLRDVDPGATENLSGSELRSLIVEYERSGDAMGLQSERAHMKWAYLMSVSDGEIATSSAAKSFFSESSKHPDDRIDDVMDEFGDAWSQLEQAQR